MSKKLKTNISGASSCLSQKNSNNSSSTNFQISQSGLFSQANQSDASTQQNQNSVKSVSQNEIKTDDDEPSPNTKLRLKLLEYPTVPKSALPTSSNRHSLSHFPTTTAHNNSSSSSNLFNNLTNLSSVNSVSNNNSNNSNNFNKNSSLSQNLRHSQISHNVIVNSTAPIKITTNTRMEERRKSSLADRGPLRERRRNSINFRKNKSNLTVNTLNARHSIAGIISEASNETMAAAGGTVAGGTAGVGSSAGLSSGAGTTETGAIAPITSTTTSNSASTTDIISANTVTTQDIKIKTNKFNKNSSLCSNYSKMDLNDLTPKTFQMAQMTNSFDKNLSVQSASPKDPKESNIFNFSEQHILMSQGQGNLTQAQKLSQALKKNESDVTLTD